MSETERAREALGIIEHEMQPIPGFPPSNVVALTMGEAEVIRAALRAALSATATEPVAWDIEHTTASGLWVRWGRPYSTEAGARAFVNDRPGLRVVPLCRCVTPAVPVAPSEENEK